MARDVKLRLDDDFLVSDEAPIGSSVSNPASIVAPAANSQIDVTQIVEYSKKIAQIGHGFNKMTAPIYIRDFSVAYDITSNMLFTATRRDLEADNKLQFAESIAYLEKAADYLTARDIKDTAEARKRYVAIDPDVQKALAAKAETTAVVSFLRAKLTEFKMAIESVKKIAYGDMYLSPDEGV